MARELAQPMPIAARAPRRRPKPSARREMLKSQIMVFAEKTHPDFRQDANHRFLLRMSEFTEYASLRELRAYRRRILRGEEEDYPLESILKKDGGGAKEIAAFLGHAYFKRFCRVLGGPNNIHERALSGEALKWALGHGDTKLRATALAGIAQGAAREVDGCQDGLFSKAQAERSGLMGLLSRKLGGRAAWELTDSINEVQGVRSSLVAGVGFLTGAVAGATAGLPAEGNWARMGAIAIIMGSALAAGAALAKLFCASFWGLRGAISHKLKKLDGDGHL